MLQPSGVFFASAWKLYILLGESCVFTFIVSDFTVEGLRVPVVFVFDATNPYVNAHVPPVVELLTVMLVMFIG